MNTKSLNKMLVSLKYSIISVYLVFGAFITVFDLNQYDSKRAVQLILFLILGLVLLTTYKKNVDRYSNEHELIISKRVTILLLFFILSGSISVFLSKKTEYALLDYSFYLLLLLLIILIIPKNRNQQYILGKYIFFIAVAFSILYIIIFWGNYIISISDPETPLWPNKFVYIDVEGEKSIKIHYQHKDVLYFVNERFFNHIQTWTTPLLAGTLIYLKRKKKEILKTKIIYCVLACWWMLIFASGARGTIAALVGSMLLCFFIFGKDLYQFVKVNLITISTGLFCYVFFFHVLQNKEPKMDLLDTTDDGRLELWSRALNLWWEHPFFGIGPMHFAQIRQQISLASPHNEYLQFLTEWGVVAFIGLMLLLIIFVRRLAVNFKLTPKNQLNRIIYISFSWSFLAGISHAFVSGILKTPMSQCWMVLIVAWLLGYENRRSSNNQNIYKIRRWYLVVAYLILLGIVLYLVFNSNNPFINEAIPGTRSSPRFWGEGRFR